MATNTRKLASLLGASGAGIANDGTLTSAAIGDVIVSGDIADNAIDSEHYVDGSIDTAHVADDAITQAKIGADAVGTTELANDVAISTSGAITTTGAFTSIGIDDNSNALAMTIDSTESIGIGTSSPAALLHIDRGTTTSLGFKLYSNTGNTQEGGPTPIALIENDGAGDAYAAFGLTGVATGHIGMDHTNDTFRLTNQGDWSTATGLSISTSNSVGINVANPTTDRVMVAESAARWCISVDQAANNGYGIKAKCGTSGGNEPCFGAFNHAGSYVFKTLSGGTTYTNNGSVSSLSDKRVKKEINDLTDGLDILNDLKPRTFKYNGKGDVIADDNLIQGFIADEVLEVCPEYVEIGNGYIDGVEVQDFKSLGMGLFTPMIVKAIQELSAKNDALETVQAEHEASILALEAA